MNKIETIERENRQITTMYNQQRKMKLKEMKFAHQVKIKSELTSDCQI